MVATLIIVELPYHKRPIRFITFQSFYHIVLMIFCFLLGGHDLEMLAIRALLEEHQIPFIDRDLAWGAKWNDYQDVIDQFNWNAQTLVGLELSGTKPERAKLIDHHNELSHLPSSIEQVATLLGFTLSRYQLLVSANDKGYIPAMRAMGATEEEIQTIRRLDRQAQGVTEEMESAAEPAIAEGKRIKQVLVIESAFSKFAPIADRLANKKRVLIYFNNELTYYGLYAHSLQHHFAEEVAAYEAYFGGQEPQGYFGFGEGKLDDEKKRDEVIRKICKVVSKPYSHHIFLFPFKWDVLSGKEKLTEQTLNERCNLAAFTELLGERKFSITGDRPKSADNEIELKWNQCQYGFGSVEKSPYNYSEYTYFYDFVQHALFDVDRQGDEPIKYFELEATAQRGENTPGQVAPFQDTFLSVSRLKKTKDKKTGKDILRSKSFQLELTSINLHAFNTGVGVLSFFAENYCHPDSASILLINQLVRRIYPEFLEMNPGQETDLLRETQLATMLAKEVKFSFGKQEAIFDYTEYSDPIPEKLWKQTYRLPSRIYQFFPAATFTDDSKAASGDKVSDKSVLIRNVMDDRMFTLCWYGNNELSGQLRQFDEIAKEYVYEANRFWFTFFSMDNPNSPTVQNSKLLRQYIERFTYGRWANYGTLYGVTRETFVILSEDAQNLAAVHAPPIHQHIQQMYYQMVILCLVQRASVLRFTGEITPLAQKLIKRNPEQTSDNEEIDSTAKLVGQVSSLYGHYIDFLNRIYIREITAQIQGDELYTQLQNQMELKADVDNLGKQLSELNTYVDSLQRKEQEKITSELNTTVGWLAPLSITLSIIGGILSFIGIEKLINWNKSVDPYFGAATVLYIVITVIITITFLKFSPTIMRYIRKFIRTDSNQKNIRI